MRIRARRNPYAISNFSVFFRTWSAGFYLASGLPGPPGEAVFFLHDGRTTDLVEAIRAHKSDGNSKFGPSEANAVIDKFNRLDDRERQDLLNFLRSLSPVVARAGARARTPARRLTSWRGIRGSR
jgi:Di-haem oxidoreductase, putative peroxidase